MVFKHHVYIPWDFVLLYCNVTDTNVKIGIIRNSGRSIKEFLLLRYVHFRISASPVMLQFEVEEFTTQSKLKNFKNVMIKVDYLQFWFVDTLESLQKFLNVPEILSRGLQWK
jgi:hypothetical protein